jgi:hypothetical protein
MDKEGWSGDSIPNKTAIEWFLSRRHFIDIVQLLTIGSKNKLQTKVSCRAPFTELFSSPFISRSGLKTGPKKVNHLTLCSPCLMPSLAGAGRGHGLPIFIFFKKKKNYVSAITCQDPKHCGNEVAIVGVYKWLTVWHGVAFWTEELITPVVLQLVLHVIV